MFPWFTLTAILFSLNWRMAAILFGLDCRPFFIWIDGHFVGLVWFSVLNIYAPFCILKIVI